MLKNYKSIVRVAAVLALLMSCTSLLGQNPTATGVINGTLVNKDGISIVFNTDPAGVTLGAAGSSAATAGFGTISAFGPLSGGVTRPSVTPANFTVRTLFDVQVIQGGTARPTYTLSANLAAVAPVGLSYKIDAVTLTTTAQTIQTNGAYNTNVAHNLDLVVSTSAPGSGGPAVNTPITTTINFTATAN